MCILNFYNDITITGNVGLTDILTYDVFDTNNITIITDNSYCWNNINIPKVLLLNISGRLVTLYQQGAKP